MNGPTAVESHHYPETVKDGLRACGSAVIKWKDEQTQKTYNVTLRTLDWIHVAFNLHSQLLDYPAGKVFSGQAPDHAEGIQFVAQYAFSACYVLNDERHVLGGINTAGLTVHPQTLDCSEYPPTPEDPSKTLSILNIGAYILAMAGSIDEVKQVLDPERVSIWAEKIPGLGLVMGLHMNVVGPDGKCVVIQFLKGKMEILDNETGVLTNDPQLSWHLTHLRNFVDITVRPDDKSKQCHDARIKPMGPGQLLRLPGDLSSASRFVQLAFYMENLPSFKSVDEVVQHAFSILSKQICVRGTVEVDKFGAITQVTTPWHMVTVAESEGTEVPRLYWNSSSDFAIKGRLLDEERFAPGVNHEPTPMVPNQLVVNWA